ncbi:MFS transporter [Novosphingobium sp. KN65.2]|uniref:MFS transporter n=1 Tax=Novosphingobium sp. KN65.2 TaxID=1478134 RepID=UPI0005E33B44|nr:MFS transporter [Novosphingobium sp. KN65.2]CDO34927.1 Major facilitator superfamily MFS_1 [Novosphingobium sp. KN65.2]
MARINVAEAASGEKRCNSAGRFLALYALAWAGATIAYTPFLTILLPVRAELLAGGQQVQWLAATTFAGAMAASLGNIAFGWLSDLSGQRRIWVGLGLVLSGVILLLIPSIERLPVLIAAVIGWQLALNMMMAPLSAWAGDGVPDRHKGILGGLLAFAPALGAFSGAFVTIPGLAEVQMRFVLVVMITCACVVPLLVFGGRGGAGRQEADLLERDVRFDSAQWLRLTVTRMWFARLLVQITVVSLFAYLYIWFRSIDRSFTDSSVARLLSFVLLLAAPVALWAGRWADLAGRPIAPLRICAIVSGAGLALMALANDPELAMGGYIVFGISSTVFLSLHSAQTLRILPDNARRGRDLGFFNLTNTVPSLIVPSLTMALVPALGFPALFAVLTIFALSAAFLLRRPSRP